jgi:hypothetical protein
MRGVLSKLLYFAGATLSALMWGFAWGAAREIRGGGVVVHAGTGR